jgi:hypothetical protein
VLREIRDDTLLVADAVDVGLGRIVTVCVCEVVEVRETLILRVAVTELVGVREERRLLVALVDEEADLDTAADTVPVLEAVVVAVIVRLAVCVRELRLLAVIDAEPVDVFEGKIVSVPLRLGTVVLVGRGERDVEGLEEDVLLGARERELVAVPLDVFVGSGERDWLGLPVEVFDLIGDVVVVLDAAMVRVEVLVEVPVREPLADIDIGAVEVPVLEGGVLRVDVFVDMAVSVLTTVYVGRALGATLGLSAEVRVDVLDARALAVGRTGGSIRRRPWSSPE